MAGSLSVRHLDDRDVLRFQEREWRLQRVWWTGMALLLVIAVLGLFSSGPLSETVTGGPEAGIEVKHERFVRNTGIATWTIYLQPQVVEDQKASMFISDEISQAMRVQGVTPTPSTETSTQAGLVYEWDVPNPESPPVIRLTFRPDALGLRAGEVRSGEGPVVPIWMWVHP